MSSNLHFAPVTHLHGHRKHAHGAQVRRQPSPRLDAAHTPDSGAFLLLGLLLAIAAGLIGLRAALWLPPMAF